MILLAPFVPFLVAVLLGGGLVVAIGESRDDGGGPSVFRERAYAPVAEPLAGELAARFRPWLRFDSKERWRPVSIEGLLAERLPGGRPAHEFCTRSPGARPSCETVRDLGGLEAAISEAGALGATTYLDIAGRRVKEYRTPERRCRVGRLQDCDDTSASAIYYRVTSSNGRYYVDYWWFMRYNHFAGPSATCFVPTVLCGEHEGDWEGVTLATDPDDPEKLDYVSYAAHTGTFRYPADRLKRHPVRSEQEEGQRPEVFIARGSHAAYPKRCSRLCTQPIAFAGINVPETSSDGKRGWGRNDDDCEPRAPGSCLLPFPDSGSGLVSWVNWAGLWGVTCGTRCRAKGPQAPESPGLQTRYLQPWCSSQNGAPICDVAAPGCGDWLGPVVAVLACNPRAIALGLQADLPSGGLEMKVFAVRGGKREPSKVSATTTGVVQALGRPLEAGSQVRLTGAGDLNEIHLRARAGRNLLEARFEPFAGTSPEDEVTIEVDAQNGRPTVHATVEGRTEPIDPQTSRVTLGGGS